MGAAAVGLAIALSSTAVAGPGGSAGVGAPADPGSAAQARAPRPGSQVSVTLITGDRVVFPSATSSAASIVPGQGRSGIRFVTHRFDGRLTVVPSDALPLVQSGALDRRLFDVTGLIETKYDDAHRSAVPLIVSYDGESAHARGQDRLTAAGGQDARDLPAVDATAIKVEKKAAEGFWDSVATGQGEARTYSGGIDKIWLDGLRKPVLDKSVPQIGAPEAWEAGYTGKGVTVAVLDTGIDATHPDLEGRVAEAKDFSGEGPGDGFGHGTHVASTIAGTAEASDGKYKGVAPDAKLLDGKVCDSGGSCSESAILAGMEWAATEKQANVVNLSLGGGDTPELDPLEEAVNTLTEETGTLFVIAAGNYGPDARTVDSPGSADAALTVGAVDKQDEIADFSGRGPRIGDGAIKPDLTAPGVDIVAAKAEGTEMGDPVGDSYVTASGTSMATPHAAGAAALLAQQHPDWKAQQLKPTLTASAKAHPDLTVFDQGAGRVDLAKAIKQSVFSEPGSVSFGLARWPHGDDEPITKKVTYRNNGSADVTLDLTATMTGPDGEPAPASAVKLSADKVTVPAGGTAEVEITSATSHDGPDGAYSGRLVATAGDQTVATPLGVEKEVESYDLTIKHLGREGKPATDAYGFVYGLDKFAWQDVVPDAEGVGKVRLPKGTYLMETDIIGGTDEEPVWTRLVQPLVTLDKAVTIKADARKAKPVTTTLERQSVRPALIDLSYDRLARNSLGSTLWVDTFDGLYAGHLGPEVKAKKMISTVASQWAEPGPEENFSNSPYFYGLVDTVRGRFFTGFERLARDRDFAKVTSRVARQLPDRQGSRTMFGFPAGSGGASAVMLTFDLPTKVTSFLEPGSVRWEAEVSEFVVDEEGWPVDQTYLVAMPRTYKRGESIKERWNTAVVGPAFPESEYAWAERIGNEMSILVPMYSDGFGHAGDSLTDTARTTLYREGRKVAESEYAGYLDEFVTVPSAKGSFRLETEATRPSYSGFSTTIDTTWTFTSGRTADDESEPLPLAAVRFSPKVDQHNRNHDGTEAMVPLTIQPQAGSKAGKPKHVEVAVSVDDGKTWKTAETIPAGDHRWVAVVVTPESGAEYVSLRAKASDSKGNTVEQTILRAYAIGS
jgi:subtilisin family serine protease